MVADTYTIKIKKFITNPLLERKQFAIDVVHPNRANISKSELKERLSKLYKVSDSNCIILFGFKTAFGGSRSSGFGLIYDNLMSCKRFEKRYRLARFGICEAKSPGAIGRRAKKDIKNRQKKVRGKEKAKISGTKK